jgi:transcriptional regulator with XRE-family HTH domain
MCGRVARWPIRWARTYARSAQKPWTQEQLAGAADVDVRTVQRAEKGEPVSAESLQAIAGALDVSVEVLRGDPRGRDAAGSGLRKEVQGDPPVDREDMHENTPGADIQWATWAHPEQGTTATNKIVTARFLNRNHNKSRKVQLVVE